MMLEDSPNNRVFDRPVSMNERVSQIRHLSMRAEPVRGRQVDFRKLSSSFANNLQLAFDRGARLAIVAVSLKGQASYVPAYRIRGVQHVREILARFKPHTGASATD